MWNIRETYVGCLVTSVTNSFCNWIRILFLIRIWFSPGLSSPIYSVTDSARHCRLEMKSPGKTNF